MILWIKALHIISFVSWFAALFYLPRLFVYHAMADKSDTVGIERFKVMERKLYRGIMNPAMIATIVFGIWTLYLYGMEYFRASGWLHTKILLVVLLIGYHHICGAHMKRFAKDSNQKSHVYFRFFNEVPVLLLIAIVILAVVKPF